MRSKSISAIFPVAFIFSFCWLHSLCVTFWSSSHYFKLFLLFYLLQWSVLNDLWCYYCHCSRVPWTVPIYDTYVLTTDKWVCVLTAPLTMGCSPFSLPSPWLPYFLRHNNIEIRSIKNPSMALKFLSEKNCTSLTLNQKLEVIKLSEERSLNVRAGWKARPLVPFS